MANVPPLKLNRNVLSAITGGNPEAIRQFENLFLTAEGLAQFSGTGDIVAANAAAAANAALAALETVRKLAELVALGPPDVPVQADEVYIPPAAAFDDSAGRFETVILAPVTGFSYTVPATGGNVWLILEPATGLASGTIVLPDATGAVDGQQVLVSTWDQILALTVTAPGAAATYGMPSVMGADSSFRAQYARATNSWYSVA